MDLQSKISQDIWKAIENSYQAGQFTGAILDAMHYIGNSIRERTGLQSDGVTLIGQAFGGKTPMLKVNKLQTESDWNIQKGIDSILRGFYQAIRNPRSHDKYNDNKEDADAIIHFINYVAKIILQSKPPFTIDGFLKRVFDKHFVQQDRYAELLVKDILPKYRLDTLIELFRMREEGKTSNLKLVFDQLCCLLTADESYEFCRIVSDEMKLSENELSMRITGYALPNIIFDGLDEDVRLRIENRFLQSVKEGTYNATTEKCTAGALGSWFSGRIKTSILKSDFIEFLLDKLETNNTYEQNYVFRFFFANILYNIKDANQYQFDRFTGIIYDGLNNGDKRFYEAIKSHMENGNSTIKDELKDAFDNFKEKAADDDIPF